MEQNYFEFDQQYYKQTDGLVMDALTSSMPAEIYIQHTEHKQIYPILIEQQIIADFRYVDYIIYYLKTNTEHTLNEFNKLQNYTN
jgi:hypothetical protein